MFNNSNTEQGFKIRTFGDPTRSIVDVDGLWLVKRIGGSEAGSSEIAQAPGEP